MGWLQKTPIVSLLFAVAIAAVPFILSELSDQDAAATRFENAREEARDYFARNPRLDVDPLGEFLLDAVWVAELRETEEASDSASSRIELPSRPLARSQARLDVLVEGAYEARLASDPSWRFGVLDAQTETRDYVTHAFIHQAFAGIILSCLVLLLVGAPLERSWGSPVFASFVMASIPATAQAYRLLDGSSGVPWIGAGGLSGALLGAYFIRGLGGYFVLPGWILLPGWLAFEAFVVRNFWIDDLGSVPWATLIAAIGFGAACAGALRLMNVEAKFSDRSRNTSASVLHPVIVRAAGLRSEGDLNQAFDLIQAAWRGEPDNQAVSEAFFDIAVEVAKPEAAASAILPSLRIALHKGEFTRAVDYWLPLACKECKAGLEPTALVRLSEALLESGHAEQALFSMRSALEAGASSANAIRVVRLARDLDEGLTRRAAMFALADSGLESQVRAELELIVAVSDTAVPMASLKVPALSRSEWDRSVSAEHQVIERTSFTLDLDQEFPDSPLGASAPNKAVLVDQALDAGALSMESLAVDARDEAPANGDISSQRNDPASLNQDAPPDPGSSRKDEDLEGDLIELGDLESPDLGFNFALGSKEPDVVDLRDDETFSDFTPLIDATDGLTSPLATGGVADALAPVSDQRTAFFHTSYTFDVPATLSMPPTGRTESAFGGSSGAIAVEDQAPRVLQLRGLKAIEAVPIQASAEWIAIDARGRGKSKLPLSRIQAISVAAVDGLGPRPVLLLDFVLNWTAGLSESMKLIRFRSDSFDPLQFVPGAASPLEALTTWIGWFEQSCMISCLSNRDTLEGGFARFASLREYEREALMAEVES